MACSRCGGSRKVGGTTRVVRSGTSKNPAAGSVNLSNPNVSEPKKAITGLRYVPK